MAALDKAAADLKAAADNLREARAAFMQYAADGPKPDPETETTDDL